MGHYDSCRDADFKAETHHNAADGLHYQKCVATLRPIEVYRTIVEIHDEINSLRERVVGRVGVEALERIDDLFRGFYTGKYRVEAKE